MKTKLIVLVFAALILVSSCCKRAYPVKTVEKEIIRTEYVEKLRIDTVTVELPQETKEIVTKDTVSHLKIKGALSDAMISNGLLHHSLKTDPDYKPQIQVQIKEVTITKDSIIVEHKEIPVKMPLTKYEKNMINLGWCFIGLIVCILVYVGVKIYRKFMPI